MPRFIADAERYAAVRRELADLRSAIARVEAVPGRGALSELALAEMHAEADRLADDVRAYDAYASRKRRLALIREEMPHMCGPDADGWVKHEADELAAQVAEYEARFACAERS
jgi:hypothetical protein